MCEFETGFKNLINLKKYTDSYGTLKIME